MKIFNRSAVARMTALSAFLCLWGCDPSELLEGLGGFDASLESEDGMAFGGDLSTRNDADSMDNDRDDELSETKNDEVPAGGIVNLSAGESEVVPSGGASVRVVGGVRGQCWWEYSTDRRRRWSGRRWIQRRARNAHAGSREAGPMGGSRTDQLPTSGVDENEPEPSNGVDDNESDPTNGGSEGVDWVESRPASGSD